MLGYWKYNMFFGWLILVISFCRLENNLNTEYQTILYLIGSIICFIVALISRYLNILENKNG